MKKRTFLPSTSCLIFISNFCFNTQFTDLIFSEWREGVKGTKRTDLSPKGIAKWTLRLSRTVRTWTVKCAYRNCKVNGNPYETLSFAEVLLSQVCMHLIDFSQQVHLFSPSVWENLSVVLNILFQIMSYVLHSRVLFCYTSFKLKARRFLRIGNGRSEEKKGKNRT